MSRLLRRLLVIVVLALGLLLLLDRLGAVAASRLAARNAEHAGAGSANVRILGFPFLTQLARGRLDHVTVSERDLGGSGLRIDSLDAVGRGVHISVADAVAGRVRSVPVDQVTGTALITYASLSTGITRTVGLRSNLTLTVVPHGAGSVTATVTGPLGLHLSLTTPVPTVSGGRLQLGAFVQRFAAVLPAGVARDLTLPLPTLPYGLTLGSATAEDDGLHLAVSGSRVTIR